MMRIFALIALALLPSPVMAQDAAPNTAPDIADGYPMAAQYTDSSADLPRDGSGEAVLAKAEPPMLLDEKGQPARFTFIAMEPGQTLLFRIDNGKVSDVRMVDADSAPKDGEIRATMESKGGNTMLTVLNKGPQAYNYSAAMLRSIDANDGKSTSVCTLLPGISAFEMWPYPIPAIAIGEFTPAPDGEMVCK
jgi:hypothetical protein